MQGYLATALVLALPCGAIAQIASLQIKVLEGEGVVHQAGAHISRPLTVQVTDDSGHPVAGAAVTFQLPAEGPSGVFSNGLRTDLTLTGSDGHATLHSMQVNRTAGPFHLRVTAVKEQARAGIVSIQYVSEKGSVPVSEVAATTKPAPKAEPLTPAKTPPSEPAATHSPGITPTTAKMGAGISKKWLILGVLAAGAGAAFAGVSHSGSKSGSSTTSSSVVSIGTPIFTIGSPNP